MLSAAVISQSYLSLGHSATIQTRKSQHTAAEWVLNGVEGPRARQALLLQTPRSHPVLAKPCYMLRQGYNLSKT